MMNLTLQPAQPGWGRFVPATCPHIGGGTAAPDYGLARAHFGGTFILSLQGPQCAQGAVDPNCIPTRWRC